LLARMLGGTLSHARCPCASTLPLPPHEHEPPGRSRAGRNRRGYAPPARRSLPAPAVVPSLIGAPPTAGRRSLCNPRQRRTFPAPVQRPPMAATGGCAATGKPRQRQGVRNRHSRSAATEQPEGTERQWRAQSQCRCGRGEASLGADVSGVCPVPVQMWRG
jgi:hypothetical protein